MLPEGHQPEGDDMQALILETDTAVQARVGAVLMDKGFHVMCVESIGAARAFLGSGLIDLMFVGDRAYRFTSGRGLGHVDNMLEVLACTKACRKDTFASLFEQLPIYSSETSALICVLLDWDEKRRSLIEFILKTGIPVIVFVIIDSELDDTTLELPAQLNPNQFIPLRTGDVQSNLQQLGEIVLTAND